MKDQRKVANLFVRSSMAFKFGKLVLISWLAGLALNISGNYYLHGSLSRTIASQVGFSAQENVTREIDAFLLQSIALNVITFTILAWAVLAFLTVMNHRVFGPVESLKEFVGHLRSGNYDPPKRSLREKDELVPLMDELNALADSLKEREAQS
jgi:HAMP domain-containing protein